MKNIKKCLDELLLIKETDYKAYSCAYDNLLWLLSISPMNDLKEVSSNILKGSYDYFSLPVPMKIMIARMVILQSILDKDKQSHDNASTILSLYKEPDMKDDF